MKSANLTGIKRSRMSSDNNLKMEAIKARQKSSAAKRRVQALMRLRIVALSSILLQVIISLPASAQLHNNNNNNNNINNNININKRQKQDNVVAEMQVLCHSDAIILKVNTNTPFNGMLYAKDAPSSNNCFSEFHSSTNMTFRLPLKSCGTLFAEVDDGIEYFNTVVVQPHMRLMTNQGKGYHIRCKYQTRERTIANTHFNVSAAFLMQNGPQASTTPLLATASMPSCTMKIFRSGRDDVAETVKIGDKLIMVIEIDQQDMYGMKITNCVVRDGMNLAEQLLINDHGCPLDEAIMPKFDYTNNFTRAAVSFPAHKFPHISSVYYQCNVRLCINNGNCDQADCTSTSSNNNNNIAVAALSSSANNNSAAANNNNNNNLIGSASSPAAAAAAAVLGTAESSTVVSGGSPRRKRFASSNRAAASLLQASQESPQAQRSEPSVAMLPAPSELRSRSSIKSASQAERSANQQQQQQQQQNADQQQTMTFDVYSGLYVSDVDVGESGSSEPIGQPISANSSHDLSPSASTTTRLGPAAPGFNSSPASTTTSTTAPIAPASVNCMNWARVGLLLSVAACVSLGVVLMVLHQFGLSSRSRSISARSNVVSAATFVDHQQGGYGNSSSSSNNNNNRYAHNRQQQRPPHYLPTTLNSPPKSPSLRGLCAGPNQAYIRQERSRTRQMPLS